MAIGMEVVPTLNWLMNGHDAGEQVAAADPDRHGEEDPERQVAVEEREAPDCAAGRLDLSCLCH